MKSFLLLLIFTLSLSQISDEVAFEKFQKFVNKYHKHYRSAEEYFKRFQAFRSNLQIFESKVLQNKPSTHHVIGITKFSDLTDEEFRKRYLGLKVDKSKLNFNRHSKKIELKKNLNIPDAFDWINEKGVLLEPKNQYSCGSCWAFSIVGHLEALYFMKYGVHKTFSEQQLVDCDAYDAGCNGGEFLTGFKWIKENGGLQTDDDYPYEAKGQTCQQDTSKNVVEVNEYQLLESTDEEVIKQYLYEKGPLAIGINAYPLNWYASGVIDWGEDNCAHDDINHAVILVGYGHDDEDNIDYWRIRNSWGASWGEKGYFRVSRGKGTCGVNQHISFASIK